MISQENWKLKQLGIIEWIPKYQKTFRSGIFIPKCILLLIIVKDRSILKKPIIKDILLALHLNLDQVLILTSDCKIILSKKYHFSSYRLKISKKMVQNNNESIHISSIFIDKLIVNSKAKRKLWKKFMKLQ